MRRRRREDRPVERHDRADVEDPQRPVAERLRVDLREHRDRVARGGHGAGAMQHAGAEQVERHRRHGVDHERAHDVEVHDANPAAGACRPLRRAVARPDEARVTLLDAPVGIHHELGGADAGDAENRNGRRQAGGRKLEAEAVGEIAADTAPAGAAARRPRRRSARVNNPTLTTASFSIRA